MRTPYRIDVPQDDRGHADPTAVLLRDGLDRGMRFKEISQLLFDLIQEL